MDGLTCTRKIRELEKEGMLTGHVPIIAVTANARAEQVQTALDAGMVSCVVHVCCIFVCYTDSVVPGRCRFQTLPDPGTGAQNRGVAGKVPGPRCILTADQRSSCLCERKSSVMATLSWFSGLKNEGATPPSAKRRRFPDTYRFRAVLSSAWLCPLGWRFGVALHWIPSQAAAFVGGECIRALSCIVVA